MAPRRSAPRRPPTPGRTPAARGLAPAAGESRARGRVIIIIVIIIIVIIVIVIVIVIIVIIIIIIIIIIVIIIIIIIHGLMDEGNAQDVQHLRPGRAASYIIELLHGVYDSHAKLFPPRCGRV